MLDVRPGMGSYSRGMGIITERQGRTDVKNVVKLRKLYMVACEIQNTTSFSRSAAFSSYTIKANNFKSINNLFQGIEFVHVSIDSMKI